MIARIVIRPTMVFKHPNRIIAGNIILSPDIFPKDVKTQVFLASGEVKNITLHSMITTSPEAFNDNVHGFTYSGDIINEDDLIGDVLISTISFQEAHQQYNRYNNNF